MEPPASKHVLLITQTGNNKFDWKKVDLCDRWIVIESFGQIPSSRYGAHKVLVSKYSANQTVQDTAYSLDTCNDVVVSLGSVTHDLAAASVISTDTEVLKLSLPA